MRVPNSKTLKLISMVLIPMGWSFHLEVLHSVGVLGLKYVLFFHTTLINTIFIEEPRGVVGFRRSGPKWSDSGQRPHLVSGRETTEVSLESLVLERINGVVIEPE